MKRKSKGEFVLDVYDREAMGEVTAREIAIINEALIAEFGEGGAMAPAEIARILHQEDLPIRFDQIFRMATPTEKYENLFAELAYRTATLDEAAASLRQIDELFRKFKHLNDRTGIRFARQTAKDVKAKATALAQTSTLSKKQQAEQTEIARWYTVWLETPDIFVQWLELRQATAEFKTLFQAE